MDQRKAFLESLKQTVLDTGTEEEPKHDYYVDGVLVGKHNGFVGVTTYIGETLFPKFDQNIAVQNVINGLRYNDPQYIYYQKKEEEILDAWKFTAKEGSDVHNLVDEVLKTKDWSKLRSKYPMVAINLYFFLNSMMKDCVIYASEVPLVDRELKITGCTDALFFNVKENTFILVDWKANTVKKDSFGKFGHSPATLNLPDNKYFHYHCQVNIYAHILEKCYGIKCSKLIVVGFGLNKRKEEIRHEEKRIKKDQKILQFFTDEVLNEDSNKKKKTGFMGMAPVIDLEKEQQTKKKENELHKIIGYMGIYDMKIDTEFRDRFIKQRTLAIEEEENKPF